MAANSADSIAAELVRIFEIVTESGEINEVTPEQAYWVFITDTGEANDQPVMVPNLLP